MLRRLLLPFALMCLAALPANAQEEPHHHHAVSLIGTPKYPPDFKHFDYVNPDAPKGGLVRMAEIGSFDSLNPILYKGEAAAGLGLIYETLMQDSLEEFLDLLWLDRRMGVLSGRLFLRHLQAPRGCALA